MADATVVAVDPPTEPPPDTGGFDSVLHIPPFDAALFSENNFNGDSAAMENQNDDVCVLDDLDFDFSFDDLGLPPSGGLDNLLNPTQLQQSDCEPRSGSDFAHFAPEFCQLDGVFKSTAADLCHLSGDGEFLGDQSWDGSGLLNSSSPEAESHQISSYLNMQSPESNGSNRGSTENCGSDGKGLSCHSPESQGSGNFESNVSEDSTNNCAARSVSSSPNSSNSSVKTGVVDQKIKLEESANINSNISVLKRKKEGEDLVNNSTESRNNKFRKSNCNSENNNNRDGDVGLDEEEEKKKARLLRNRESAQLSRQRKKHYVEELEDKVRNMHSTIQDLNAKITYFMAENATLKQQMGGGGPGGGGTAAVPPPPMAPPLPGMYTHPAMMYPWMPYAPPYMMKSQGSQVPLVPIPRLKPQQQAQAPKSNKKVESKKNEGPKTKKVAGVSFLGLLFFMMLFGCLVPMVNVRYGGTREVFTGGESYIRGGFNQYHHGRVLMVNGTNYDEKHGGMKDFSSNNGGQRGHGGGVEAPSIDEFVHSGNGSEPLAASLYVPRNDKLVKIDGNLIIHSVLASEKAMACKGKGCGETGLVVPRDLAPAIPGSVVGRNGAGHTLLRALGSGSVDKDGTKSTASDGKLQQWFREGLAGPMLSAGMCTEVFQFDVSAAIVPATSSRNLTEEQSKNSTHPSKAKNRRILHPIPFPESSHNISGENAGRKSEKEEFNINNKTSSMVVSVLFDPREAGDADVDGVMGTKSFSRIFVVVLMDSVKYVTYSCMLQFKGSGPHLVTT